MHANITIKLIAEQENGRLLGAQLCGLGENVKRLDVLATALKFGAKVVDLIDLDLAYAPPFAMAIDVLIHTATTLAFRVSKGIAADTVYKRLQAGEKLCILDVRESDEVEASTLPIEGTVVIGLGELRERWDEIPADSCIVTVYGLGIRAYEASCMLQGKEIREVAFLQGGISVVNAYFK